MANRPRRRRKYSSRNKNHSKKSADKSNMPEAFHVIPSDVKNRVIIFDTEDFYSVFLDILLMNLGRDDESIKVESMTDFERFKRALAAGEYANNIYIIDELFGHGEKDINIDKIIQNIKIIDPQAYIIGTTALKDAEIEFAELYDAVAVKSKGNVEHALTGILAEKFGVELKIDNSDPEYN